MSQISVYTNFTDEDDTDQENSEFEEDLISFPGDDEGFHDVKLLPSIFEGDMNENSSTNTSDSEGDENENGSESSEYILDKPNDNLYDSASEGRSEPDPAYEEKLRQEQYRMQKEKERKKNRFLSETNEYFDRKNQEKNEKGRKTQSHDTRKDRKNEFENKKKHQSQIVHREIDRNKDKDKHRNKNKSYNDEDDGNNNNNIIFDRRYNQKFSNPIEPLKIKSSSRISTPSKIISPSKLSIHDLPPLKESPLNVNSTSKENIDTELDSTIFELLNPRRIKKDFDFKKYKNKKKGIVDDEENQNDEVNDKPLENTELHIFDNNSESKRKLFSEKSPFKSEKDFVINKSFNSNNNSPIRIPRESLEQLLKEDINDPIVKPTIIGNDVIKTSDFLHSVDSPLVKSLSKSSSRDNEKRNEDRNQHKRNKDGDDGHSHGHGHGHERHERRRSDERNGRYSDTESVSSKDSRHSNLSRRSDSSYRSHRSDTSHRSNRSNRSHRSNDNHENRDRDRDRDRDRYRDISRDEYRGDRRQKNTSHTGNYYVDDLDDSSDDLETREKKRKDYEDDLAERREVMWQIRELQDEGILIPSDVKPDSDLNYLKFVLNKLKSDNELKMKKNDWWSRICMGTMVFQTANNNFNPFNVKIENFDDKLENKKTSFDSALTRACKKYSFRMDSNPLLELGLLWLSAFGEHVLPNLIGALTSGNSQQTPNYMKKGRVVPIDELDNEGNKIPDPEITSISNKLTEISIQNQTQNDKHEKQIRVLMESQNNLLMTQQKLIEQLQNMNQSSSESSDNSDTDEDQTDKETITKTTSPRSNQNNNNNNNNNTKIEEKIEIKTIEKKEDGNLEMKSKTMISQNTNQGSEKIIQEQNTSISNVSNMPYIPQAQGSTGSLMSHGETPSMTTLLGQFLPAIVRGNKVTKNKGIPQEFRRFQDVEKPDSVYQDESEKDEFDEKMEKLSEFPSEDEKDNSETEYTDDTKDYI